MNLTEVLTTALGGGGLAAVALFVLKNLPDWWRHRGEQAAQKAEASSKNQELAFTLLAKSAERLDADVVRLSTKSDKQQQQIDKQQEQIDELQRSNGELAQENRSFLRVIQGVIERLRRKPPEPPEHTLAYIFVQLPHLGKEPHE